MLWTCLHFPDLPLAVFARGTARKAPAVVSSASHRPDVVAANDAARKRGIVPGLSIAAALALDPEIAIHLRDERAEANALKSIALWAGQWTSTIAIEPPASVLLEIAAGLNYFGGLEKLLNRIDAGLAAIGFSAVAATAPTAGAASLLARAGRAIVVEDETDWTRKLSGLPVTLLESAQPALDTLSGIGVRTLGELIALPREGVARRFGQPLLDEIDRALAVQTDPRLLFVPPERYHGQLELPAPIEENESLLFGVKRLVAELAGFLHGRGTGVTRLRCDLVHEDVAPTSIVVGLTATRQIEHMMNVLRERLARETLPDRVEAIRIVSEEFALLGAKEGDFFPVARKDGEAEAQLIERLRARLGEDAVHKLELCADHRPELSSGQTELIADAKARYFEGSKESAAPRRAADLSPPEMTLPIRPLWLLASPRPLGVDPAAAEIKLTSGPERIETGWWDGKDVGRDYFVARNARGEALWLYRERGGEWFVHGVFA
ncbi:MAG TPA: DNA polymerase Y family protein [Casimicrobiaceae bacterium]|jgi:protein ImuB|nr:DNA polymerase Y family protein [Casimicrobiaceae bacterium]